MFLEAEVYDFAFQRQLNLIEMKHIYIIITFVAALIAMAMPARAYEPTVREDRVWENFAYYYDPFDGIFHHSMAKTRFKGTEILNGKEYHKWVKIEEITWKSKAENIINKPDTTLNEETIALMREEDGRIWICLEATPDTLYNDGTPSYRIVSSTESIDTSKILEKILHDFTLNEGDTVRGLVCYSPMAKTGRFEAGGFLHEYEATVINSGFIEICGQPRKKLLNSWGVEIIESIGSHDLSSLARPTVPFEIDSGYGQYEGLNGVYDDKGNKIYGEWIYSVPGQAGISEIETARSTDGRMYDLMGREIRNPAPGTIYIQGGRKLIAR